MVEETRLARALGKHYYVFGAPAQLILPCYVIPVFVFVMTGWLWELIIPGALMHLWLRHMYLKDDYWLVNYIRALKMPNTLEP